MRRTTSIAQIAVGRIGASAVWLAATVVAASGQNIDPLNIPDTQLEPVKWSELDGWARDDHGAAYAAFQASCEVFNRQRQLTDTRPVATALKGICQRMPRAVALKGDKARAFFEENFRPVRIAKLGENSGLLTGYYEPIVEGLSKRSDGFDYPLYRKPSNLLPGGRMAVVDFHEKLERARLLRDTEAAGLCVAAEHGFLPQQHFVIFH